MPHHLTRSPLPVLLLGLLLTACGSTLESPDMQEPLGTTESALCSSSAVTELTISGISTYEGEMAGMGTWSVSQPANAARLEFRIDNVLQSSSELLGTSGTWYFSKAGVSCGWHTFNVKAWPMVIDSNGNRTTCWGNTSLSVSENVYEACPPVCGDYECTAPENDINCPTDCCYSGFCANGACCSHGCSDGSVCMIW